MKLNQQLSRRQWLRLGAGGMLAAGLWPGALRAEGARDSADFHFVVVNDLHYQDQRCGRWLERVFRQMRGHAQRLEFCLLVGDLADHGTQEELGAVRDLLPGLNVPTYVVRGNHDWRTQTDCRAFEQLFPTRLNYHFEHRGWQFVGLDTTDGLRYNGVAANATTQGWLRDTLPRLDRTRPTVLFTHFPLGPGVTNRLTNADELLTLFQQHNLRAVFGGHFHGLTERTVGATTVTTNRCCSFSRGNHDGSRQKGYFLCHARDGRVQRTFVEAPAA